MDEQNKDTEEQIKFTQRNQLVEATTQLNISFITLRQAQGDINRCALCHVEPVEA